MTTRGLCPDCRAAAVTSARAALAVLADQRANTDERHVAGDVLAECAQTLRLPPALPSKSR